MSKIKRVISALLVILILLLSLPINVLADEKFTDDNKVKYKYVVKNGGVYISEIDTGRKFETFELPSKIDGKPVKGVLDYFIRRYINAKKVIIPDSIETLSDTFFDQLWHVESLYIGKNLRNLSASKIYKINQSQNEYEYPYLNEYPQNIHISKQSKYYSIVDDVLYNKNKTTLISILPCKMASGKGDIILPKTVKKIYGCLYIHKNVEVHPESEYLIKENGTIYNKNKTELILAKITKDKTVVPSTVKKINNYAFRRSWGEIVLPNSITEIPTGAFCDSTITKIVLPDSIEKIGNFAFKNCTKLKTVKLSKNLKTIGSEAFKNTGAFSLTIPDSVTKMGKNAFENSKVKSVKIGKGLKTIPDRAFYKCEKLTDLSIGKGVKTIGEYAFYECMKLKAINIPNNVTKIKNYAFCRCCGAKKLTIGTGLKVIQKGVFYQNSAKSIIIPKSVTEIQELAFSGCKNLTTLNIGKNVKKIEITKGFDSSFYECENLYNIKVDKNNKYFSSYNGALFNKKQTKLICCPSVKGSGFKIPSTVKTIGKAAFFANVKLKSVIIPNSVTTIEECAFSSCSNLTSITIPSSVKTIERCAFMYAYSLKTINIPTSVKKLGEDALGWYVKGKTVNYSGTKKQWNKIKIDKSFGSSDIIFNFNAKECKHKYSAGADLECNRCGYYEINPTLRYVKGVWYYYNNGIIDKSNTLVKHTNGKLYHVKGGKRVKDTAIVKYEGKRYYVKKGVVQKVSKTVKVNGKTYKIKNGIVV